MPFLYPVLGKGKRNAAVRQSLAAYQAVYFATVGGAAALIAERIKAVELIAYADLKTFQQSLRMMSMGPICTNRAKSFISARVSEHENNRCAHAR